MYSREIYLFSHRPKQQLTLTTDQHDQMIFFANYVFAQVMTALGIVTCYVMGRSLAWNWLSLGALIFLVPFTFGLYYIPESPPWLVYNDEEDLAFKSMSQIRGEEYDATCEIEHFKVR